jgi:CheY-like chemotaxis protein
MSKPYQFFWIDDTPTREANSKIISDKIGANINFINLKGKTIDEVEQAENKFGENPDLIIIDHKLTDSDLKISEWGSAIVEGIRDNWPNIPVLCVTAVPNHERVSHQMSIYDYVITFDELSNHIDTIESFAKTYREYTENGPDTPDILIERIGFHPEDRDKIKSILPMSLKVEKLKENKTFVLDLSFWINRVLLARPGFLYDRQWAANYLGLKESSFEKVEELFVNAEYSGPFARDSEKRWWQLKLRDIVSDIVSNVEPDYPRVLGRSLPGIKENDFSVCYISGEEYPEIIAYTDKPAKTAKPMKINVTEPHPGFEYLPYFEEIRMYKKNYDDE